MCRMTVFDAHFLAIEIRSNGFYLYNSWKNTFSNAWFSGLEKENKFFKNFKRDEVIDITEKYNRECGIGKLLTKSGLKNCFTILENVFYTYYPTLCEDGKQKITINDLVCRDLNKKFKALE